MAGMMNVATIAIIIVAIALFLIVHLMVIAGTIIAQCVIHTTRLFILNGSKTGGERLTILHNAQFAVIMFITKL